MEESVFLIFFLFPFLSLASNQTLGFLPTAASLSDLGEVVAKLKSNEPCQQKVLQGR